MSRVWCGMIRMFLLLIAIALPACAENWVVDVWPEGKVPGKLASEPESEVKRDDGYQRITNVSRPTLTWFPTKGNPQHSTPLIIICPGGGYRYTVVDKEGSEIAERFNQAGVAALVLKYRTPQNREGAFQDVQRAVRLARFRAAGWKIDPQKIGVIGFSAGGHVAAKASNQFGRRSYEPLDDIDSLSCRPDFAILVYPAYLDDKQGGVSPDLDLRADIPPTLIVHSEDDKTHVVGSKIYSSALSDAGKTHAFKLYTTGGHGYGLHSEGEASVWPEAAVEWLKQAGMIR